MILINDLETLNPNLARYWDKDKNKEKKNNKSFWKDFKAELKRVIWPTKKQLVNNTMVVVAMVIVTAVIVLVLDLAFEALNK